MKPHNKLMKICTLTWIFINAFTRKYNYQIHLILSRKSQTNKSDHSATYYLANVLDLIIKINIDWHTGGFSDFEKGVPRKIKKRWTFFAIIYFFAHILHEINNIFQQGEAHVSDVIVYDLYDYTEPRLNKIRATI